MFKTNSYFDGKVVSIAFQTANLPATVGVMAAGEYEFGTNQKETMSITSGELSVLLPDTNEWRRYREGTSFIVAANQRFKVKAEVETAYLCLYE
jgi:uncharacterized protein YaiE (UPF0345 family)